MAEDSHRRAAVETAVIALGQAAVDLRRGGEDIWSLDGEAGGARHPLALVVPGARLRPVTPHGRFTRVLLCVEGSGRATDGCSIVLGPAYRPLASVTQEALVAPPLPVTWSCPMRPGPSSRSDHFGSCSFLGMKLVAPDWPYGTDPIQPSNVL